MNNKPKFTKEQVKKALEKADGLVSFAARILKCTPQTVRRYLTRWPDLLEIREEGKSELVDIAEATLKTHLVAGKPYAVSLVLKTLGRDRGYGDDKDASSNSEEADLDIPDNGRGPGKERGKKNKK
ncbi:MAG TPA: hypothetical protein VFJ52_06055 [Terriglobia bacterium]|nr:hypothetical protein [Terriglobia bacterium]